MTPRASTEAFEQTIDALLPAGEGRLPLPGGGSMRVLDALPGERIRVEGHGHFTRVSTSPERTVPPCEYFGHCGGCAWQHASASLQRSARMQLLARALPPSARGVPVAWVPCLNDRGFRTRARLAWKGDRLGFRTRGSRNIVEVAHCLVLHPSLERVLRTLRTLLPAICGAGEVAIALGRDQAAVAAIVANALPTARGFAALDNFMQGGFAGVTLKVPWASAPAVIGDPRPWSVGADGEPLVLSPGGFAQSSDALNRTLAGYVCDVAQASGRTVLELHAGAGNFTVGLARVATRLTAVEAESDACAALAENLRRRNLTGVTIVTGSAEDHIRRADVVVLDPPRTGARDTCDALCKAAPKRIVYVSCDVGTLGRDLEVLSPKFAVTNLRAFEMFPYTPHIETVAVLERRTGQSPKTFSTKPSS